MKLKSQAQTSQAQTVAPTTNDPFFDLLLNDINENKPNRAVMCNSTSVKETPSMKKDDSPGGPVISTPGTQSPLQDRKISSSAEPQPAQATSNEEKPAQASEDSAVLAKPPLAHTDALLPTPDIGKTAILANNGLVRPPIVNDVGFNRPINPYTHNNNGFQPRIRPQVVHPMRPNVIITPATGGLFRVCF